MCENMNTCGRNSTHGKTNTYILKYVCLCVCAFLFIQICGYKYIIYTFSNDIFDMIWNVRLMYRREAHYVHIRRNIRAYSSYAWPLHLQYTYKYHSYELNMLDWMDISEHKYMYVCERFIQRWINDKYRWKTIGRGRFQTISIFTIENQMIWRMEYILFLIILNFDSDSDAYIS